ncbi:two-component system, NtrC family, nitrogen regulation sensor histidine kinase GlnL [Caenispirillum bisanense]|uniref:histidine kinase n=1 Tax=Caenispirillum bisanense TaxID=414052 RepID=A0A286GFC1_9PROT|nr:two-component system, NtrC family, nitrogen regulation sensor histidine kinase GlnL [Caenispirillum bisanense]
MLNTLPTAVMVLDDDGVIREVNTACEHLFELGSGHLCGMGLTELLPADSPVVGLVQQVRDEAYGVSEHGVTLDSPRTGLRTVTVQATPVAERRGWVVLALVEQTLAIRIGQQMGHRNAARSVSAMSALLAHEIKNPLSGIRGAAQLLEQSSGEEDRVLTRLIMDEADRIVKLVERMEVFSDTRPPVREPVNIHQVMEHVRRIAESGFGRAVRFTEHYDPSLPPVPGDRDQLVQVFLNLVKNAVEAAPEQGGEVILSTGYQHGVRVAVPGSRTRMNLPLVVSVQDNGEGIPDDLRPHLFDPFVTTKPKGSGLGLALVAKIVNDHGGIIEFDSQPRRTVFKVMLPILRIGGRERKSR